MKRRDDGIGTTVEARVKKGVSCCWWALGIDRSLGTQALNTEKKVVIRRVK
jgi:hypothetical protein